MLIQPIDKNLHKWLFISSYSVHFHQNHQLTSIIKMFINPITSVVSCLLLMLPASIHGSMGHHRERNYQPNYRANGEHKLVRKGHLHGHLIETPLSEEVALIEQHQPAIERPNSVEIIEEIHEPRYSSPPTGAIITHGPLITPPHHLHLVPLRPVINPIHTDVHTKVVEVSAIHSDTGHTHRLGAFAVQPILDHLHTGVIRNSKVIAVRRQPKSRVEMFHTQQQIETLDPVEELSTPNQPMTPSGYYEEIQQQQLQQQHQQQPIDRLRESRMPIEERGRPSRSNKYKFNGRHQSEAIIEQSPIIEEKVVYTSLANSGHHNNAHIHSVQPARLVIEDNHLHHHAPPSTVATLIAEPPSNHHHHRRIVELTPATPVVTPVVSHLHAVRPAHSVSKAINECEKWN